VFIVIRKASGQGYREGEEGREGREREERREGERNGRQ
jgi:hypothetical protein